jgi:WD40 repeat protein
MALHPTIDVLVTCGRDSTARVWDMRTKANIHTLTGHTNTVASVVCQAAEPQVFKIILTLVIQNFNLTFRILRLLLVVMTALFDYGIWRLADPWLL